MNNLTTLTPAQEKFAEAWNNLQETMRQEYVLNSVQTNINRGKVFKLPDGFPYAIYKSNVEYILEVPINKADFAIRWDKYTRTFILGNGYTLEVDARANGYSEHDHTIIVSIPKNGPLKSSMTLYDNKGNVALDLQDEIHDYSKTTNPIESDPEYLDKLKNQRLDDVKAELELQSENVDLRVEGSYEISVDLRINGSNETKKVRTNLIQGKIIEVTPRNIQIEVSGNMIMTIRRSDFEMILKRIRAKFKERFYYEATRSFEVQDEVEITLNNGTIIKGMISIIAPDYVSLKTTIEEKQGFTKISAYELKEVKMIRATDANYGRTRNKSPLAQEA